ncbi:type II toxin-antitoxin system RelE/ParE family toxin [Haloechinothrix sp. YIM 98757]|uniref:Type II toxin-antitoxin system RelE/ParE family toxin n=1 Tax=Haloechinothrix aidingensis TaxID=2752311 RepID=A0A838A4U7_9PSEU|nr:type II toxin-antitoxin system RelE/ParE family toxin [Haloechinothrix aidingensis]MBA0124680.1 type II toxin-antitoxin system RelE/ParE family toxin [Haloechinothrix aidingensis]
MTRPARYEVAFTRAARRSLHKLPLTVAQALHELLTGPVADNPYRLGKQLDAPYDGVWSTRRGDYRALYTIDEAEKIVTVIAVAHRRDAYRAR